jgi:hypothetical protein
LVVGRIAGRRGAAAGDGDDRAAGAHRLAQDTHAAVAYNDTGAAQGVAQGGFGQEADGVEVLRDDARVADLG